MTLLETLSWETPKAPRPLPGTGQIHLWKIDVSSPLLDVAYSLSGDEQQRSQQMSNKQDRIRFCNARGSLRTILASYLNRQPATLRFEYGAKGKPRLSQFDSLHFNLTHAGNLALVAISSDNMIGIDLEKQQQRQNLRKIAQRVFSADLMSQIESLDEKPFERAFFLHWTQMEARVKALGQGVFTRDSQIAKMACTNFIPEAGWFAALATTDPLPEPDEWQNLLFTPDLAAQIR